MERVKIFYQAVPLNDTLAEPADGQADLPEAYAAWLKECGDRIEIIERQFRTTEPLPGLDGGHIVMSIAVFYRQKTFPNSDG